MAVRLSGTSLRFFQLEKADIGIHGNDSTTRDRQRVAASFDSRDRAADLKRQRVSCLRARQECMGNAFVSVQIWARRAALSCLRCQCRQMALAPHFAEPR